ncbi:MAG: helix-turn-helix domain-containing protein [Acidaminococcaceae bacterium]|nr:helix-turn-helix domain-containing protein [Acidaminococcaceae bacterium]
MKINNKFNLAMREVLTEPELAEYLGVSIWTVRRLRCKEGLPVLHFKTMRSILYYRPAVDDWLRYLSVPEPGKAVEKELPEQVSVEEKDKFSKPERVGAKRKRRHVEPMAPIPD